MTHRRWVSRPLTGSRRTRTLRLVATDPFSTPLSPRRRAGARAAEAGTTRRRQGSRGAGELTARYTARQLRHAYRSVQSPVASTVAALAFGLGIAVTLIGGSTLSADALPSVAIGLVLLLIGGAVLMIPFVQAQKVMQSDGIDGLVTLRLLSTQHGLMIEGPAGPQMLKWSSIERVQMHDAHVGFVSGGRFVIPPLRLDDEQGPFVASVLAYLDGNELNAGLRPPVRGPSGPPTRAGHVPSAPITPPSRAGVLAVMLLFAVGALMVMSVLTHTERIGEKCTDDEIAVVTRPGGTDSPIVVTCHRV